MAFFLTPLSAKYQPTQLCIPKVVWSLMPKNLLNLLNQKPYLHWWVQDKDQLSESSVVFAILNYGDLEDFKLLIKELSLPKVKKIFERQLKQKRHNYNKKTKHFFSLYFQKYGSRNS